MGEIVIEEINYKAYIILFADLCLLIGAGSLTAYGLNNDKVSYWLPGIIAAAILFAGCIGALIRAVKVRKLLTITRDGIIDNSSIQGVGFISFEDIKEFMIVTINNKKAIAVIPKNIASFLAQLSMVKRRFVKRNIALKQPPVTIYVNNAKDMEPEDILTLLQKRLSDISSLED